MVGEVALRKTVLFLGTDVKEGGEGQITQSRFSNAEILYKDRSVTLLKRLFSSDFILEYASRPHWSAI